jgi:hypothetical protein
MAGPGDQLFRRAHPTRPRELSDFRAISGKALDIARMARDMHGGNAI